MRGLCLLLLSSVFWCCLAVGGEDQAPKPPPQLPPPAGRDAGPSEDVTEPPVVVTASPIVVTAERISMPADRTGISITVLDGKEEQQVHQNSFLSESLRQAPGLTVSQSGLPGDFTTLFTRGGNSNQTLFLYDGWKVNRQGGNFELGLPGLVGLDRIEVARGPASSLFGTDAVTGVVNLITAKGSGRPLLVVSGAGGTFGTDRETLAIQGSEKKFSYNIETARLHRHGATFKNSELETYDYSARLDYQINCDHSLKAIVRGQDFHKGLFESSGTGYGPAVEPADPNDQLKVRDVLVGLEYRGRILPIWETTLRGGHYLIDRRTISDAPNPVSAVAGFANGTGRTFTQERRPSLDWQNDITAFESPCEKIKYIVSLGTNIEQEQFNQDDTQFFSNSNVERSNWSLFLQNRLELYERAFVTAGMRREQNGQFGDFLTARADASILIPESGTRLRGSVGNAFRAPSFFELFSGFGNPDLQPEENFAFDAGIEQRFWKERIALGATWFDNDFKDLVNFSLATSTFDNISRAKSRGFEFFFEARPVKQLTIRATSTLLHTENDTGRRLLRRPGNTYTAQIIAHPIENLDLSLDLNRIGSRSDLGPAANNPFATVRNPGYTRVDAAVSYRFLKHFRAFGRVENLFNRSYEEVRTFPAAGSNVLAGLEFSWRF